MVVLRIMVNGSFIKAKQSLLMVVLTNSKMVSTTSELVVQANNTLNQPI